MVDHEPWVGDTPYFLLIVSLEPNEGGAFGHLVLDVDKPGWQVEHKEWLERSAEWYLCEKMGVQRAVLAQIVHRGEQPYYVKRHVGQVRLNDSAGRSVVVHGIGKKVPALYETYTARDERGEEMARRRKIRDKRTDRLWLLPGGVVCGGEDVEKLAMAIVATMDWEAAMPDPGVIEGSAVDVTMVPEPDHRERDAGDPFGAGGDDRPVSVESRRRRPVARGNHPGQP